MNKTVCWIFGWLPIWFPGLLIEIWAWTYTGGRIPESPEGFWTIVATLIMVITLTVAAVAVFFLAIYLFGRLARHCQQAERNCRKNHDDN